MGNMKKRLMKAFGIRSECERHAEIGQWMAQGFADGLEKGVDKSDMSTLSTIYGQDCPFCEGTGISYFGQGLKDHHICGICRGSGKEIPQSMSMKVTPEVMEHLKDQAKDAGKDISDRMKNASKVEREQMIEQPKRDDHTVIDPLIESFSDVVWEQQAKVLRSGKYPHPIHKDNHSALEWVDHQMSEFADALVYHECMKQTIQEVIDILEEAHRELGQVVIKEHPGIVNPYFKIEKALARLKRG